MAWGWLKKKLEGAVAQVNPFDNGRTYDTVVNQKQPGYRQREAGQPVKPSYGWGFAGLINRARDVVDANTPQDRFIRQQLGQPLNYYDQQKQFTERALKDPTQRGSLEQIIKNAAGALGETLAKTPGAVLDFKGSFDKTQFGKIIQYTNPMNAGSNIINIGKDLLAGNPIGTEFQRQATDLQKFGRGWQDLVENKVQQSSYGNRETDNKYIAGASRAVGQLGSQVLTSYATGGTILPAFLMGTRTFSDEQKAAKDAGLSDSQSFRVALGQGIVEGALEKVGLDKLKGVNGNLLFRTGKRFLTEGTQEGTQQLASNIIANKTYDPSRGFTEGVKESALFGGIAGGVAGTAFDINPRQVQQNNQQLVNNQVGAKGKNVNDPLESLKQEARKYKSAEEFVGTQPMFRGASKAEWDAVQKTGKFGKQEAQIGNPKGFFNDDVHTVSNKKYAQNYAFTGDADGVVIEYKQSANSKMRNTSLENTTDMGAVQEARGKGLTLDDVQRVTDRNGNVLYDARKSAYKPGSKVQNGERVSINSKATRDANAKSLQVEEGGEIYEIRIKENNRGDVVFDRYDSNGNFMDSTTQNKLKKAWGNLSDEQLAEKSVYGNGKLVKPDLYNQATKEATPPVGKSIERFGWNTETTPQGTKLFNRNGKHVATITEKNGRFTASYTDGQRIATGANADKLAEDVARKTFYAQELPQTQNLGGTLRPDKAPEPYKNTVRQGELTPERAAAVQSNTDRMKSALEFDKTPAPKKAYHSTASLEIEGGKLRASPDGAMGEGVYLHTNPETAKYAGAMQSDGNIADQRALDVNIKTDNLYKWADQEYPTPEQVALIKKRGYDGIYRKDGELIVFDPNQIELAPPVGKPKGFILSETKPLNSQKIQKVRTAPGEVEQRVVQDRSDEIADALGIRAKDRVPTTDSQRAERVDTAAQNGLENIKNNPEIVRQAAAPSTLKDKTKRKTFEEATKKYLGGTRSAEIERQATIASLNKEFKLSDKEKINAIISRDDPSVPALNEKVMRYNDRFKQLTDAAYKSYTDQGVKMGYVSSYLPRIYKNPETGQEVDLPEFKALIQGSKRMKGREAEKVAVDWLVEKDPTKLLERYYKSMDNAVAGRQYMKDLEDNGLVVASTEPVRGMRPVIAEGLQTDGKVFYAQKDVAHKLNELFGSKEATNLVEKTLEKGAGVNSLFQSFVLSGGVPNTPINSFGMMQLLKEGMALHPVKAGRAFFGGGLSKSYANKVFTAKKDIMKLMAENDLDIRVNLEQTGKWGNERIRDAFKNEGKAAGLNQAWNEFTNDATFGRFMPMLEVLHFENVYKHQLKGSLIRKPKSSAEAARIAAESTKNFYGKTSVYKTSTRSKAVDDAAGALLFAPRFRESMVNFWVKNAKALVPTNYGKAEYRDNQKFMVASAVMYAAMTMLNEAMNGARMDENPDGKKDKLIIPASVAGKFGIDTKGKDIAVPYLPSIATVPRNLASLGANLATGKFNEAGKNAKAFASMPVKTVGDILTNEDYFGNKIVQDDSSPIQKFTQAASYVASSNMQPWIREALNAKGQKWDKETKKTWGIKEKSTFETLSNAGELPLRFYKPDTYRYGENWTPKGGKDEKFDFKQQRERAALGGEIKNISKTLGLNKRQDELFKSLSSVEFNDDGTLKEDNNPFYKSQRYTALQDDGVFEAMKQRNILDKKINGKPVDPLYGLNGEARRLVLWKMTLPQGTEDPSIKDMYRQEWYQNYRAEQDKYYRAKNAWNNKMGYKNKFADSNPYPEPNKQLQSKLDQYYKLPYGTGARSSFINQNPDLLAHWDRVESWKNGERALVGLGPLEDKDSYYSGGKSYSRGGRRKSGGGRKGSKGVKIAVSTAFAPSTPKAMKLSSKKAPAVTLKVPKVNVAKSRKTPIKLAKKAKTIKSVKV